MKFDEFEDELGELADQDFEDTVAEQAACSTDADTDEDDEVAPIECPSRVVRGADFADPRASDMGAVRGVKLQDLHIMMARNSTLMEGMVEDFRELRGTVRGLVDRMTLFEARPVYTEDISTMKKDVRELQKVVWKALGIVGFVGVIVATLKYWH